MSGLHVYGFRFSVKDMRDGDGKNRSAASLHWPQIVSEIGLKYTTLLSLADIDLSFL